MPSVAIVGRPNVGKSTLFNRLIGSRVAIVHDAPGVTRDRNAATGRWEGREIVFVDTGGVEAGTDDDRSIAAMVARQSRMAIAEADVVLFVLDARAGLSPADTDVVTLLRRSGRPVVYAVNKIDSARHEGLLYDFARLGVDPLIPISAEHARGIDGLMRAILERLPPIGADVPASALGGTRLALVGRPNVGKSSLLNRLAGYERALVDTAPGTTRDPVDTPVILGGRPYVLVDTAGIRRRSRVAPGVERLTAMRALRTIDRAEIALLVLDAAEGITDQDLRIAAYAWQRGRGLGVLFNKWDLMAAREIAAAGWLADQRETHPTLATIPALCVSSLTGWQVDRLPALVETLERDFAMELPTGRLNQVLQAAVAAQAPPMVRGRTPRLFYATQVAFRPPVVAVFTSDSERIRTSYVRYLEQRVTAAFGIRGAPLRLTFRRRR